MRRSAERQAREEQERVATLEARVISQTRAIHQLTEALRLTVEYVGTETLPPVAGWSWYDALLEHAPADAAVLRAAWQDHHG